MYKPKNMTLIDLHTLIKGAKCPEDIFGTEPDKTYKLLVRICHPDMNKGNEQLATSVFVALNAQWEHVESKKASGTYGDMKPTVKLTVAWKGGSLSITGLIRSDGMFKYLRAYDDAGTERMVKLPDVQFRSFADNEIRTLKKLLKERPVGNDGYSPFPVLIDSFQFPVGNGVRVPSMVLATPKPSDLVTLMEVNKSYPNGLNDPRDMVWMLNRMLSIVALAGDVGIIHGGLNPGNVFVSPAHHLGYVDSWHFATPIGDKVKAVSAKYGAFTAPEILAKDTVGKTTDLYACACIANWLMMDKGNLLDMRSKGPITVPPTLPRLMAGLLRVCLFPHHKQRTYDTASDMYNELSDVLKQLYGPRKFRPFTLKQ